MFQGLVVECKSGLWAAGDDALLSQRWQRVVHCRSCRPRMPPQTHYTIIASPIKATVSYNNRTTFVWNTKGEVIAASAILPFLGIVLVALRFYNGLKYKVGIGADDWLIVPATVS